MNDFPPTDSAIPGGVAAAVDPQIVSIEDSPLVADLGVERAGEIDALTTASIRQGECSTLAHRGRLCRALR
ncbi:MAG: hypothetical protein EON58_17250 [Alphaproteobacteria bacterium]|nr:MAG: hypothetical protein EON58_17250 [Alphaproteobacteria bacterium]